MAKLSKLRGHFSFQTLLICAFFVFLTILFTFPAFLNLSTRVMGGDGDSYQFLGFQNLGASLFYSGQFPFGWTNEWRYPFGINFQSSIDSSLFVIMGVILRPLIDNPILTYNLSVLAFLFLNLSLSYIGFRTFFRKLISIAGAVIYGASFYALSRSTGHLNLLISAGFLFSIYSFVRLIRENGSKKSLLLIFISLILLSFTSLQYVLIFVASLPFIIIPYAIFFRDESQVIGKILWNLKYKLLAVFLIFFIIFSLFHGQKVLDAISGNLQLPTYDIVTIDPVNFFSPNKFLETFSSNIATNESKNWIENSFFLGFVEIVLFVFALFKLKDNSRNLFLAIVTLLLFIISLGVQPFLSFIWPYQYLFPIFPFRGIIEPARFFVVYFIGFTFLILHVLKDIKNKWILLLIILLLVIERIPKSYPLNQYIYTMDFVKYVNNSNSRAVLNLPLYYDHWNGGFYDYYSAFYNKPIVEGYIHWSGDTSYSKQLINALSPYTCQYQKFLGDLALAEGEKTIALLKQYEIRTIVFHRYISYYNCEGPVKNMEILFQSPLLTKVYEDIHTSVFEIQ